MTITHFKPSGPLDALTKEHYIIDEYWIYVPETDEVTHNIPPYLPAPPAKAEQIRATVREFNTAERRDG